MWKKHKTLNEWYESLGDPHLKYGVIIKSNRTSIQLCVPFTCKNTDTRKIFVTSFQCGKTQNCLRNGLK